MPGPDDTNALPPDARRREIARILATAVVRLRTRSAASPACSGKLSESSRSALASASCSATHVTVREAVNAKPEDSE